jgi:hypothetical protein
MKKQIAKTISILSLFVMLSVGSVNVSAGGSVCSIPSCRPRSFVSESTVTQGAAHDPEGQAPAPSAQSESSYTFAFFLAQWAMYFLDLA